LSGCPSETDSDVKRKSFATYKLLKSDKLMGACRRCCSGACGERFSGIFQIQPD
jgi:hypothetical protein